jgi:hypothetical protein
MPRQLGLTLDNADGVEGRVFRTNFLGLAKVRWEGGVRKAIGRGQ